MRLKPSGIFSLQTHGSENYINDELASYLSCLNQTLNVVFKNIVVFPGDIIHFFAASDSIQLTKHAQVLIHRIQERKLATSYIREYYLPFRLSPDRFEYLNQVLESGSEHRINRDFHPLAYYFNIILWSTQFSQNFTSLIKQIEDIGWKILVVPVILLLITVIVFLYKSNPQHKRQIIGALSVLCLGFTALGSEILILLIFQILHGYVYQQLAILIAAFMAGLSLGAYLSLRQSLLNTSLVVRHLLSIHLLIAILVGLIPFFFQNLIAFINPSLQETFLPLIFIVIIFLARGLGGYLFPLAGSIFYNSAKNQNNGLLYSLDLLGAMFGALILSSFIIPLFGLYSTGFLLSAVNIFVASLLAILHIKLKY